jgi:hypothetical protein
MKTNENKKPLFVPTPTLAQVHAELRGEIKMYLTSYRELDGKVHNEGALWTIACLQRAIEECMPKKKGAPRG